MESVIVPVYKQGDRTDLSNYSGYYCYQVHKKF